MRCTFCPVQHDARLVSAVVEHIFVHCGWLDNHPLDVFPLFSRRQGKRVDAFLFKERSLVLRQKLYGASHRVVTDCAKDLTLQYSVVAMDLIRGGDTVESLKLLEKAQILSSSEVLFPEELPRKQLLAVMYNNFGCYYKLYVHSIRGALPGLPLRRAYALPLSGQFVKPLPALLPAPCSLSKLHTAWKYLQKALLIESTVPGCHNPAGTHLNVCALLSQMGRCVSWRWSGGFFVVAPS
jgi:hypothetical protein